MRQILLLTGTAVLMACGGGTATYRVELSGSLNQGAQFQGAYSIQSGQLEVFATALPASKAFSAGANEYVFASGTVAGGGTITARVFKGFVLCEEKTLNILTTGSVSVACNKP